MTKTNLTIKEKYTMKKALFVLALAVALTFMFAAAAFADHSPTFYVEWNADSELRRLRCRLRQRRYRLAPRNYLEGTEKCGVCHSVHRAPVYGVKWDTNPADPTAYTAVAGGLGVNPVAAPLYP